MNAFQCELQAITAHTSHTYVPREHNFVESLDFHRNQLRIDYIYYDQHMVVGIKQINKQETPTTTTTRK